MKTYTVEQIRNYLQSCDSFGDALYFLDEEHIDKANEPKDENESENEEEIQ